MSKYKLSPQDYRQLLSKVELENITLVETRSKLLESNVSEDVDVSVKESGKHVFDNNLIKIYLTCIFTIIGKESKEEIIKITCKYRVDFSHDGDVSNYNDEFVKILTENTVKITVWPYFRQELSDLVSKMNFPGIVLPLKRR